MSTCAHCDRPVLDAVMGMHHQPVQLDPEPLAAGTILLEPDGFARFIAPDRRDPKSVDFVAPELRYRSHRATCPANERTHDPELDQFLKDCDRRVAEAAR